MRTLFLGGVVVPALHIGVALLWVGALFVYPAYVFGLFSYVTVVGGGIAGLAAFIACCAAIVWLWQQVKRGGSVVARSLGAVEDGVRTGYRRWQLRREDRDPGLLALVWRFFADQHNKVCRKISFVDTRNAEDSHVLH